MAFTKQTRETGEWLDAEAIEVLFFVQERITNTSEHVRQEMPRPSLVAVSILERATWACGVDGQRALAQMARAAQAY